ncbi:lnt, apolipo protein N-acyltransferase [Schizophyllum fasciatum]
MEAALLAGSTVFGAFSMSVLPSFYAVAATLAILTFYAPIYINQHASRRNGFVLFVLLTVAGTLARVSSAESALSTPASGVLLLLCMSLLDALILLVGTAAPIYICSRGSTTLGRFTLLPAVWSTVIYALSSVSPLGRLALPAPTAPAQAYAWLEPLFGPAGIDILAAAWAAVIAEFGGIWYMGEKSRRPAVIAGTILLILAVPSFFSTDLPFPLISPDTTPISVGCALPSHRRYSHPGRPTFDDFVAETRKLVPRTDVLLWPESAVIFDSVEHRNAKLQEVRAAAQGTYVGVGFLESFRGEDGRDHTRNGFALVSAHSTEPDLLYFKRNLVPIAESYSMTPSTEDPSLFTLPLRRPSDIPKSEWAPPPSYTRPIPVSASICLDYAAPNPFAALESRPALLLGPAFTWDVDIGRMMFAQGAQRARELGAAVLWCDGGEAGVSGVAGEGVDQSMQVGRGSWVRTIAVQHPFDERRTGFGAFGHGVPLILVWVLAGAPWVVRLPGLPGRAARGAQRSAHAIAGVVRWLVEAVQDRARGRPALANGQAQTRPRGETTPLLIDV